MLKGGKGKQETNMSPQARTRINDRGCPLSFFHTSDNPAPEYEDEYSIGAWMRPPAGARGRRRVCNSCVRKIQSDNYESYSYNRQTHEVAPANKA